ncbi:MAG: methyltransferase domain-containing protein [Alphaproteobacteria bacterium]|nr:methyltransferase domain-containing protein [Alphaproteobacteria bacterium]
MRAPCETMSSALDAAYYGTPRREILPLLPTPVERALEIGCGTGATLHLLREQGLVRWAGGIEIVPEAASRAEAVCDAVWALDIEKELPPIEAGSLDLILALDVLEHLVDPWGTVDRLVPLLRPGGTMIASIPNVRNYRVSWPLLFSGSFDYDPAGGLLDKTHLRFFVRRTAVALMSRAGMSVESVTVTGIKPGKLKWWLIKLSGGLLTDLYALQFLIRSARTAP